jgi:hypothetical protein
MTLLTEYLKNGYWELTAAPRIKKQRLTHGEIEKKLKDSEVRLRGWPFPFLRALDQKILSDCIQSIIIGNNVQKYEGFQMHKSGLFFWRGEMWEEYTPRYYGKLSFTNVNWEITEMLLFLKRLYEDIVTPSEQIMIRIRLVGCKGRRLAEPEDLDINLDSTKPCAEGVINIEDSVNASTLNASWKELARKYTRRIYDLFGAFDVSEQFMVTQQNELLKMKMNG